MGIVLLGTLWYRNENDRLYQKYAYCPEKKGRPGERVGETCFRNLKTSGEVGVFLYSTNFQLNKGIEAFKKAESEKTEASQKEAYRKSATLFQEAIDGDRTNPVPQIFFQNALARQRGNTLKLAVVVSVDYYAVAAIEVLQGVADAQAEFNKKRAGNQSLMEIVIVNDENEPEAARKIAKELVIDPSIKGVVGHHSSDSTIAAQGIYEPENMPIISPTSTGSQLKGEQFFRMTGSTTKAAEKYAKFIKEEMKIEKIAIFYNEKSKHYSMDLKDKIKHNFNNRLPDEVNISSDIFNAETEIIRIAKNEIKVALILTDVQRNSIAVAINKYNSRLTKQKLQLFGAMSLSEHETLEKGGEYVEGMILMRPCIDSKHQYVAHTIKRYHQGDINWRTVASYGAIQAFAKAINWSEQNQHEVNRKSILEQLKSEVGSKWDGTDRSDVNSKYCAVQIKNGKFSDNVIPALKH